MISEIKVYHCTRCGSSNIVRNGYNSAGSPKYLCKDCKASRGLEPKARYTPEQREQIPPRLPGANQPSGATAIAWSLPPNPHPMDKSQQFT